MMVWEIDAFFTALYLQEYCGFVRKKNKNGERKDLTMQQLLLQLLIRGVLSVLDFFFFFLIIGKVMVVFL